jgi:hypothetical protein
MPTKSNSFHMDLTLNMFTLAYIRGLFGHRPIKQLVAEGSLAHDPVVTKQAVFVCVNREDEILADNPLRVHDLNEKLKVICIEAGIAGKCLIALSYHVC